MITQKQIGTLTQLTATDGLIHKIGTDTYVKSIIMLNGETVDMYEEVSERPAYTKSQYDTEVERLIAERYTTGKEIEINRERDTHPEKYAEYMVYLEECKQHARENLSRSEDE